MCKTASKSASNDGTFVTIDELAARYLSPGADIAITEDLPDVIEADLIEIVMGPWKWPRIRIEKFCARLSPVPASLLIAFFWFFLGAVAFWLINSS